MEKSLTLKNVMFGLQHTFVMFGATILVPILTGLDISVSLFTAGFGTLLFHLVTKFKVPVFLGSSFAFIPGITLIGASLGLPYALGGIVIAGLLYILMAIIFKFVPHHIIFKLLPAYVTGPMIILIGLILAPIAIQNANGSFSKPLVDMIGVNGSWAIALFTFSMGVLTKVLLPKWNLKFLSHLPVLVALVSGYILSLALGVVDLSGIVEKSWIGIPRFSLPKFSLEAIMIMVPIALVTIIEHFGDIVAISNVTGENYLKNPGIHRTLIGDGLATSLAALMGGPANTTYSENTGAVVITGIKNPVIMQIAAVFAIILAIVPKFSGIISTIPTPVIGGISILLFGMISSVGIQNLIDARVSLTEPKTLIIVSTMLVLGLGGAVINIGFLKFTGLSLAALSGIILNAIFYWKSFKTA